MKQGGASTDAAVYREAARQIEEGIQIWTCNALECLGASPIPYAALFKPEDEHFDGSWGTRWSDSYEERQDCRILALCFMAAMVEAGDA